MFHMGFPSIIRSSKLHIQRQAFVRPILLPAASLAFRPSSGAQNCTYSIRYLSDRYSDKYLTLYVQFWAPDDGRKTHLKHVQLLTEINKLWNVASFWLYAANILAMHGHMNVKSQNTIYSRSNKSAALFWVIRQRVVEELRSHLHRGGSLKSCTGDQSFVKPRDMDHLCKGKVKEISSHT
jgi:hypothetical protein